MDVATRHTHLLRDDGVGARISSAHYLAEPALRPSELAYKESVCHPRGTVYRAPADARAVAMAFEHPQHSICGLSALAVYGLRFFADCCDTTLHGPVKRTVEATQFTPRVTRSKRQPEWNVFFQNRRFAIVDPHRATVEALLDIRCGNHSWPVPVVPGFEPQEIRAIQLIDAVRRHLGLSVGLVGKEARNRIERKWMEKVFAHSSELADSPKETEMRLMCAKVCKELGVELTEQVPLIVEGKIVTVFDLAIEDLKIAVMYDGEHHLQRKQRDRDSRVNVESTLQGWVVIRFTAGTVADAARFLKRLVETRR